jgi:hypothetical protein
MIIYDKFDEMIKELLVKKAIEPKPILKKRLRQRAVVAAIKEAMELMQEILILMKNLEEKVKYLTLEVALEEKVKRGEKPSDDEIKEIRRLKEESDCILQRIWSQQGRLRKLIAFLRSYQTYYRKEYDPSDPLDEEINTYISILINIYEMPRLPFK